MNYCTNDMICMCVCVQWSVFTGQDLGHSPASRTTVHQNPVFLIIRIHQIPTVNCHQLTPYISNWLKDQITTTEICAGNNNNTISISRLHRTLRNMTRHRTGHFFSFQRDLSCDRRYQLCSIWFIWRYKGRLNGNICFQVNPFRKKTWNQRWPAFRVSWSD